MSSTPPEPTPSFDPPAGAMGASGGRTTASGAFSATETTAGFRNFQRYTYWSIVGAVLVLLILPAISGPVAHPPDPLGTLSLIAVIITVTALIRLIGHHIPRSPEAPPLTRRQWLTWAIVGSASSTLLAGVWIVSDDRFLWSFSPALVASLLFASLPRHSRRIAVTVSIAAFAMVGVAVGLLLDDADPVATAMVGAAVAGFAIALTLATIWSWQIVVQLNEARRTAATLAVANERLRFAADLHDIQGHNLQVIALKSELAGRLLHDDPAAAAAETTAIQELAADALRDTRAVVQGYRRATLNAEISNATMVLGSAGIDTELHLDPELSADELPETCRHVLGLVVREAVTNVLRHSSATRAEVRLSHNHGIELRVTNDGAGDDRLTNVQASPDPADARGGLGDLEDRLRSAGGSLTWRRFDGRFEVEARLPTADPSNTTSVPEDASSGDSR